MTGFGELKNEARDEPFTLGQPLYSFDTEVPFESDTMCGRDTRGQITLYANAIQATQFRTHSFSFFINLAHVGHCLAWHIRVHFTY